MTANAPGIANIHLVCQAIKRAPAGDGYDRITDPPDKYRPRCYQLAMFAGEPSTTQKMQRSKIYTPAIRIITRRVGCWYGSGHHSKLPARAGARPRLASPTARVTPRPHFARSPQHATKML